MKPLIGHNIREGYYFISKEGEITTKRGRTVSQHTDKNGYRRVTLFTGLSNKTSSKLVHTLLATTYLAPESEGRLVVDHKDGDVTNNALVNLRRVSQRENQLNRHKVVAKSGITGVHALIVSGVQKWKAVGKIKGRIENLGDHESPLLAAKARYLWEKRNGATTMQNTRPDIIAQIQGI